MSIWGRVIGLSVLGGVFLVGATLVTCGISGTGPATAQAEEFEHHPAIHHALRELREARKELKDADHDFGGHREDALHATDEAIKQLEIALKFDRK